MPPLNGTPEQIFERSVAALESRRSIAARVRFRVDEFDETIVGSGLYLQQSLASGETNAAERALRFELKMPVDNASTSVIQVGDGARFWTREDLPGGVNLSVIDLERLRRGLQRQPNRVISPTTAWMALGGLPRMAQGIRQCFEFNAAQAGTLDKFPVVVLSGTWKKERLAEIAPDLRDALLAGQEVDLDKLPRHVPERVVLLLGRYDLFPYRVEYWRRMPAPRALKMLKLKPPVDKLLLAMELYEVQLDAPLDMRQFIYQPAPDVPVNDRTDAFLAGFGLKDEPQALRSPPATNRR
jgi:hypothetical protein